MTNRESLALLSLLAKYATEYGKDCDGDISVKALADDLVWSQDEPRLQVEAETFRDSIYDGLNQ